MKEFDHDGLLLAEFQGKLFEKSADLHCSTAVFIRRFLHSDYLKKLDTKIVCICGHRNPKHLKFCENCERPLNPQRNVKTRLVCSCGEILTWDAEFCSNCGKNIRRRINQKISINSTVRSLKDMFR